jgi:hypothetical protein
MIYGEPILAFVTRVSTPSMALVQVKHHLLAAITISLASVPGLA